MMEAVSVTTTVAENTVAIRRQSAVAIDGAATNTASQVP